MEGIKSQINHTWEKIQLSILDEVKKLDLPENQQAQKIRELIKERYGVEISEELGIESNKKVLSWFRSKNIYPLGLVLAFIVGGEAKNIKKLLWGNESGNETTITNTIEAAPVEERADTVMYTVPPQQEEIVKEPTPIYKELGPDVPEGVSEIHKYFSLKERIPIPDRGYAILDKTSANIYVFDKNNELKKIIRALFGKTPGDGKNTVVKAGQGQMTTPAGIYIMSDSKTEADLKEFGPYQISLYGMSLEGEEVNLGWHPIWKEEYEKREEAINTGEIIDNFITNGCINTAEEDLIEISELFKKDYGEMFFVLPDQYSKSDFNIRDQIVIAAKMMRANRLEKEIYFNQKKLESRTENARKGWEGLYNVAVAERIFLEEYIKRNSAQ